MDSTLRPLFLSTITFSLTVHDVCLTLSIPTVRYASAGNLADADLRAWASDSNFKQTIKGAPFMEDNYHKILDATIGLMLERGYHGTSVQMIADKVHISKSTIFHYFV